MKYSKEDIEYYLINKNYHELNAEELSFISSKIGSEKEFHQLKSLMTEFNKSDVSNNPIEPDPQIKTALIKEFRNNNVHNKIWLNNIMIALFPTEKNLIRKPGVQLIGIAASLMLILNIIFFMDKNSENNNKVLVEVEDKNENNENKLIVIDNETNTDKTEENTVNEIHDDTKHIANASNKDEEIPVTEITVIMPVKEEFLMSEDEIILHNWLPDTHQLTNICKQS